MKAKKTGGIKNVIFILASFLVWSWPLKPNSAAPYWFILNLSSLFSGHTSSCSGDLETDHQTTLNKQEDSFSDTSFGSLGRPHTHKTPPLLEVGMPSEPQPELPPPAPPPPGLEMREDPQRREPAPPLSQQTVEKVHNKNKVTTHLRNKFRSCISSFCGVILSFLSIQES